MRETLAALDSEWARQCRTPEAASALRRWSADESALGGLADLPAVLRARRDPEAAPAILAALARWAPDDELAAKTLLRCLMPGLVTMAADAMTEDPAAFEEMVSLAWLRIRSYPETRTGSVAGNVLLDVRKWYRRHREIEAPRFDGRRGRGPEPIAPSAEDVAVGRQVVDDVIRARDQGLISSAAARLVLRTRYTGMPLAEAAAAEEATTAQAECIRWRAECRLRPALRMAS